MASFMGLFRRWLEPPDEDNNNQRQPTPSDGLNENKIRSEMVSNFQKETERQQNVFQSEIEKLEAELKSAREETIAQQRQHIDALATKESECQRLSRELGTQIDALNNRWMVEKRKSEQLEKTMENQKTRQQQELQMQRESNARQLKELQDTIAKHERIMKKERTENLRLRNEYQRTLDAKEADCHRLNQQLIEVSGRLEDEVKVSVAEKKRREMAEAILESQTEKVKQLDVQHKDTVRQLNVVNESLAKQTKERTGERTKFDSMEKHYKETLAQKESDCGKLEGRLTDMKSTLQHQTKEMNSERRKNKILEKEIKENKDRVLQLTNQNHEQLNKLQGTVDQLTKELENERRMMTEVEKQREQALASNEINRQRFHKDLTDLNNRFESRSRALQEEKQTRQTLQMQLQEQKKIECLKDRALEMEKKAKEVLQQQLQEQKEIECQKDRALEMEKKAKKVLQLQLQEQKEIECLKDRALEMEKKAKEMLQQQLQEQKEIECQKDRALEMEKKAKEVLQLQLQEQKEIQCQKHRASEMEQKAKEVLELQLKEQKEIECQKDRALEMEKKVKEVLQLQLREKKKAECQKDDQLPNSVKQLSDYSMEILFLTKELETQRQKNVLLENNHHELVRRANDDCESLRATVTELQIRLENQAKNLLMERRKGDELEKQFQWQTEVLKHQECQLGTTRKELDELKQLFSHREIELSNERLQNAYVDVDHRTLIAVKDQECKEFERQLTGTRERLESQTQLLAMEREKRESVSKELEDQKKRQLETEERQKKQLRDLEERLKALQTPGTKEDEEDIEGGRETSTASGTDESPPQDTSQRNNREDTILENQKLSMELSVVQEKLEKATEEMERERQTHLNIQEQTTQLMAERDALMEKTDEEKEKLTSRITELEVEKRSRIQNSDNQNNQPFKRDETQSKESIKTKPYDMNTNQVIEQEENETIPVRSVESVIKSSEQVKMRLLPKATQFDDQMKRISELSEALDEEKQKNLKLTIERRHIRSQRDKIMEQLQSLQQKISKGQMPLEQQKQGMKQKTTVDEDRRETASTDSQEKVQSGNQANWTLKSNTLKATIHAKTAAGEDCTTSNRMNPLRLDESKIQELRERMKILQPLGSRAVAHPETLENESQPQNQQQHILTKIKEEPMEKKYEVNETEVNILPDEEDPPPLTKRRRLEASISTDAHYSAPYDQLSTGVRVIEIKPEPNIKRKPIEEQIARTPIIIYSKDRSKELGPITKQKPKEEPKEERGPRSKEEPPKEPVVVNRKLQRRLQKTATKVIELSAPEESVVHSPPEEARLVQTLRPQSLTTPVTGMTVLNGSLFVVSEMNSVVEVYESTTFTFSGKVSVNDLTNPQSLTSCPLNDCLYILNKAQWRNAIYRLGLAPNWHHNKWSIGTDFGALASTSTGSLLLSCFDDLWIKEFSTTGKLIRQFQFGQSTSDIRLFGAVQLHRTSRTAETSTEAQFAISYSHRRTGLRRVCTVDGNGREVNPLLKYNNGSCTRQHLIVGRQTGALFLADFGMGEVFQWNSELKNCRMIRRKKDSGFRPLKICLDQNEKRIIIAEGSLSNDGSTPSGKSKLSIYDL